MRPRRRRRAGSVGPTLPAAGPWLAGLPHDLLVQLPGAPLETIPLAFGRRRYRTGFAVRHSAEDQTPFRTLREAVHAAPQSQVGPFTLRADVPPAP